MKKYKPVILTAVISAAVLSIISYWVSHMDWAFLPYVILAGCFMVWVQKETVSYKFLDKLSAGSVMFGLLLVLLTFFRMYVLANSVYDAPMPFRELWDKDMFILAGAYMFLAFLGGLFGIFLKGLYSLYKQKLDWVIVFIGALFTTVASLAVFKIKVGGTIMSGYHGLPYSYFTYQIKDILDGLSIDQWVFAPGSMYRYLVFNYIFYLAVFIACYYLVKLINAKLKTQRLNRTFFLFSVLIIITLGFISFLPAKMSYIEHRIVRAGYCENNQDCVIIGNVSPFSCAIVANQENADRITKLVRSYPSTGTLNCSGNEKAACIQNKCRVAIDHTSDETYWEIIRQAAADCEIVSVMQTHALKVSVTLKSGEIINVIEPEIDDIFKVINQYRDKCGDIRMATE